MPSKIPAVKFSKDRKVGEGKKTKLFNKSSIVMKEEKEMKIEGSELKLKSNYSQVSMLEGDQVRSKWAEYRKVKICKNIKCVLKVFLPFLTVIFLLT